MAFQKNFFLTGWLIAVSAGVVVACSSSSVTPREPASEIAAGGDDSSDAAMRPGAHLSGVQEAQLVNDSDLSASRRKRRERYYRQSNALFGGFFNNLTEGTRHGRGGYGGTSQCHSGSAYSALASTISSCGCRIADACGKTGRGGHSCHDQGRAVDVMSVNCGGQTVKAGSRRFSQFVACERTHFPKTLWQVRDHFNHAHFSLGCSVPGHPNYW